MLREKFGRLLKHQTTVRFIKDKIAGAGVSLLNVGVLVVLVEGFGSDPTLINAGRAVVMSQVSFAIARHFTFRDRRRQPLFRQWRRYMSVKSITLTLKQLAFAGLVFAGLPYFVVYFCSTTLVGLLGFKVADEFIFGDS